MRNVGHELGRNTVKRILAEGGIAPAPERRKGMSWRDFLRLHWDAIAAADFFAVEVLTMYGLTRYFVLFVMELARYGLAYMLVSVQCNAVEGEQRSVAVREIDHGDAVSE